MCALGSCHVCAVWKNFLKPSTKARHGDFVQAQLCEKPVPEPGWMVLAQRTVPWGWHSRGRRFCRSRSCKLACTGFSLPPSWKFTSHPLYLLSKVHPFISAESSVCSAERTRRGIQPRQGEGPFQVKGPMNYVNLRTTFIKPFFFPCIPTPPKLTGAKGEHRTFMQMSHFTFKFLSPVIHDVPENR